MDLVVADNYEALSRKAADWLLARISTDQMGLSVFATGNTPMRAYAMVCADFPAGDVARRRAPLRTVTLDEYLGVAPDDPRSLYGWLRRGLLDGIGVPDDQVIRFDPNATDPEADCRRVDRAVVDAGGIGVQVLGLGPNGHLGFNEPGSAFDSPARTVDLTPESIASNAVYWGGVDQVPHRAVTLGLGALRQARETLLLVSGEAKSQALRAALHGPIDPAMPASILRQMKSVTIVADKAATCELPA